MIAPTSTLADGPVAVTPAGHDLAHWASARRRAERLDLPGLLQRLGVPTGSHPRLLVVGAHPDDETLGLGRLVHQWARAEGQVSAIVATAGEACFDHLGGRPEGLAERRLAEWARATELLGVTDRTRLGLPDGALAAAEAELRAAVDVVVTDLLDGPAGQSAGPLVLAGPWSGDPHPDHQAVGRAVADVARRHQLPSVEFGVWMTYWSEPDDLGADGRALVILETDGRDDLAHQRACAAFVTQVQPWRSGWGAVVPPAMLAHHHEQLLVLPTTITPNSIAPDSNAPDLNAPASIARGSARA